MGVRDAEHKPKLTAHALKPWLYLAPALVAMGVWIYLPLGAVFGLSFMDWNLTSDDRPFVGLDNYRELATQPDFRRQERDSISRRCRGDRRAEQG